MLRMQEMPFPCFKFQKFSWGVHPQTPIHTWYVGHTRGLQPLLSPSNILFHRKVPFQKIPPTGKSLKKALVCLAPPWRPHEPFSFQNEYFCMRLRWSSTQQHNGKWIYLLHKAFQKRI